MVVSDYLLLNVALILRSQNSDLSLGDEVGTGHLVGAAVGLGVGLGVGLVVARVGGCRLDFPKIITITFIII